MRTDTESCREVTSSGLIFPIVFRALGNHIATVTFTDSGKAEQGQSILGTTAQNLQKIKDADTKHRLIHLALVSRPCWLGELSWNMKSPFLFLFSFFAEAVNRSRCGRYSY